MDATLPPDIPLERSVLATLMLYPEAMRDASDILHRDLFFDPTHRAIYLAAEALYRRRDPIDIVTVTMELKRTGSDVSPYDVSAVTTSVVASAVSLNYKALLLTQIHLRRCAIQLGHRLQVDGLSDASDPLEALAKLKAEVGGLLELSGRNTDSLADVMGQVTDGLGPDLGVPFGFYALDRRIRPEPGTVTIIGARPAMGKTAFMISAAWRQVRMGRRVYVAEMEMTAKALASRLACGECGVSLWDLKRRQLREHDTDALAAWHVNNGADLARLVVDEQSTMTVSSLAARVERERRRGGLDCVWVDYLGLLKPSERQRTKYDHVTAISNELRIVAKDTGLPFVVMCQLSRPVKGASVQAPKLSDLRDSGEIEQDAEAVLFLHRPRYYDPSADDTLEVYTAKYRDGEVGMDELWFDGPRVRVIDKATAAFGASHGPVQNYSDENVPAPF